MLNKLRDEIHQNAVAHGWWEEKRSFGEVIALCHSELSEALEEYRNGHRNNEVYYHCTGVDSGDCEPGVINCDVFSNKPIEGKICSKRKPEGIPIELADCIIRILDYCGKERVDIPTITERCKRIEKYESFPEFITLCHCCLTKAYQRYATPGYGDPYIYLGLAIATIYHYCKANNIDIEEAIRIKHEYNKTRPHRHGGKRI